MDIYLVKTLGGALKPIDGTGEEIIDTLGAGEVVRATIKKDRNPGHHRKFFGILRLVFENQSVYTSSEGLRFAIMVASGYVDEIQIGKDRIAYKPKSLNWTKMDQSEFELFFRAALAAIPRLLPNFTGIDLEHELALSE